MKNIKILFIFLLSVQTVKAQKMGEVWKRNDFTSHKGTFVSVKAQPDGTYLASGNLDINGVLHGYLVHFEEGGQTINEYKIAMPVTSSTTVGDPSCYFTESLFLDDGSIIAVGTVTNPTANTIDKHPYNYIDNLLYGAWFVKIDPVTGTTPINVLNRGVKYTGLMYNGLKQNSVITYGQDVLLSNPAGAMWDTALLRVYNSDGNVLHDNQILSTADRIQGNGIARAYLRADGSILVNATAGVLIVSSTTYKITNSYNPPTLSCAVTSGSIPTRSPWPRRDYVSPLGNNKFFLTMPNEYASPGGYKYYGYIMAKYSTTGVLDNCSAIEPITTPLFGPAAYGYIFASPGSDIEYLGTHIKLDGTNYLYKYLDNATFPNIEIGPQYPFNTRLSTASSRDGFFSCGQDPVTMLPAIAKLSTCVSFKIGDNDLPEDNIFYLNHSNSIRFNLPIHYEGATAQTQDKVTYTLTSYVESGTVDGITKDINGGKLDELIDKPVASYIAGSGDIINFDRTYTVDTTSGAAIKYILTIKDSYITAGVDQSCSQTYVFYAKSLPQIAVVAMPLLKTEGTSNKVIAAVKNIGQAPFSNYKITIYKDNVGNSTKQTYTYSSVIGTNKTAHFEVELAPSLVGAPQLFVKFNDDGSGSQAQAEISNKQAEYEVEQ